MMRFVVLKSYNIDLVGAFSEPSLPPTVMVYLFGPSPVSM